MDRDRGERRFEVFDPARADQGSGDRRVTEHPGQRQRPQRDAALLRSLSQGIDRPEGPLGEEVPGGLIESVDLDDLTKARLLHGTALEWLNLGKDRFC